MATAWRLLFETLQFQLLHPIRGDQAGGPNDAQIRTLAADGLSEAAKVLRAAEEAASPDLDVMWRHWNDLSSQRRRARSTKSADYLDQLHAQLTIVVLAYLLARSCARAQDPEANVQVASAQSLAKRIAALPSDEAFAHSISGMFDRSTEAEQLWDEFARSNLPERQVVMIEGLRTGILRLICFWMILRGPTQQYLGDWLHNVAEDEFSNLTRQVLEFAEAGDLTVAASQEQMISSFRKVKARAERRFASSIEDAPLDPDRIRTLRQAFVDTWRTDRRVDSLVTSAHGIVVEDERETEFGAQRLQRAFLVSGTNYVGEDWAGESLGQLLADFEEQSILQSWMTNREGGSDPRPGRELLSALEELAAQPRGFALIYPIDWEGEQWCSRHRQILNDAVVTPYATALLDGDNVLLVGASQQVWHVADISAAPEIVVNDVPLSDDDTEAYVELSFPWVRPHAEGEARVWLFSAPWGRD
jgi:hypothetical protein